MTQLTETELKAVESFSERLLEPATPENLDRKFLDAVLPIFLRNCYNRFNGNQSRMAVALGINRATLRTRLKRYNLI